MKITEVIDMSKVAAEDLYEDINANTHLYENLKSMQDFNELVTLIGSDKIVIGQYYSPLLLKAIPPAHLIDIGGYKQLLELVDILDNGAQYVLANTQGQQVRYPEDKNLGEMLLKTYLYNSVQTADSIVTFMNTKLNNWTVRDNRK